MRRILLLAVAAAAIVASPALAQQVGGTYRVDGTNFDGSPYQGRAVITPSSNSTCHIAWQTGGTQSSGFCMFTQGSLAAAYKLNDSVGLVLYRLQPDGSLKGIWTLADKPGSGTEVLTPGK